MRRCPRTGRLQDWEIVVDAAKRPIDLDRDVGNETPDVSVAPVVRHARLSGAPIHAAAINRLCLMGVIGVIAVLLASGMMSWLLRVMSVIGMAIERLAL